LADDNYEGVKVSFDKENGNGWFLLRLSVHDPVMPLNIESDEKGGNKIIIEKVRSFLSKYEYLSKF
jgi:phosphomannomutase